MHRIDAKTISEIIYAANTEGIPYNPFFHSQFIIYYYEKKSYASVFTS